MAVQTRRKTTRFAAEGDTWLLLVLVMSGNYQYPVGYTPVVNDTGNDNLRNSNMFRTTSNVYQPPPQNLQHAYSPFPQPNLVYGRNMVGTPSYNPPLYYGYYPNNMMMSQQSRPPILHPNGFLIQQQPRPPFVSNVNLYPPSTSNNQPKHQRKRRNIHKQRQDNKTKKRKGTINDTGANCIQPSEESSKPNKTEVSVVTSHQSSKEANITSNNLEKKKQVDVKPRTKKDDSGGKSFHIPRKYRPPKLDTPEDIEKWRAERRKNWPSDKVIQQKEKQKKEMLERGELRDDEKNAVGLKGVGNKTGGNRNKKNKNQKKKGKNKNSALSSNKNASLLERLLKKSIEKERSAILQCFKLFVENDFYRSRPKSNIAEPRT